MHINLKQGQKLIVLRYAKLPGIDCVGEHINEINKNGFCWFGKIGIIPSESILETVFSEETPIVALYTKGELHLARLEEVTLDKPSDAYPSYYEKELYAKGNYPQMYFKLSLIEKADISMLSELRVLRSGRALSDIFSRQCMSSFLHVVYGEFDFSSIKAKETGNTNKRKKLPKNDCLYRKEGICTLRTCINFEYECNRPEVCTKQKR